MHYVTNGMVFLVYEERNFLRASNYVRAQHPGINETANLFEIFDTSGSYPSEINIVSEKTKIADIGSKKTVTMHFPLFKKTPHNLYFPKPSTE